MSAGVVVAIGAALGAAGYWLFGQKRPKDGFKVNPKKYNGQVRRCMKHAKRTLEAASDRWRTKGYHVALVSVVPGTKLVHGYWCIQLGGVWGRGLWAASVSYLPPEPGVRDVGEWTATCPTDGGGRFEDVPLIACDLVPAQSSERGFSNKRQIWCVVPPDGQYNAGVLDDRIPTHEACHPILTACGVQSTTEQHNVMRGCGLY